MKDQQPLPGCKIPAEPREAGGYSRPMLPGFEAEKRIRRTKLARALEQVDIWESGGLTTPEQAEIIRDILRARGES